jgi:PhnB protein
MTSINPYLNFNGNCEEAFNLYKLVFGSEFSMLMRLKDVPSDIGCAQGDEEKIMHVALPIGKNTTLMGSDIPSSMYKASFGTNYYISIDVDSEDEATRVFNKLSAGGKINMPLGKTFWGAFFGMLADKFGVQWMVSYTYAQQDQPAEAFNESNQK